MSQVDSLELFTELSHQVYPLEIPDVERLHTFIMWQYLLYKQLSCNKKIVLNENVTNIHVIVPGDRANSLKWI